MPETKKTLLMKRQEVRVEVKEFISHMEIIDEPQVEVLYILQAGEGDHPSP